MTEEKRTKLAVLLMKGLVIDEYNELTALLIEEREEWHKAEVKNLGLLDVGVPKAEKVLHGENCNNINTCCICCYNDWLAHKKTFEPF